MPSAHEARASESPREVTDTRVRLSWRTVPDDEAAAFARVSRWRRRAAALVMALCALLLAQTGRLVDGPQGWGALASALLVGLAILHLLWLRPRQVGRARWRASGAAAHRLEADRSGVRHSVGGMRSRHAWSAVRRLVVGRRHVFLHLWSAQVLTIPRRAFGPEREERRALEALRAWRAHPSAHPSEPVPEEGRAAFALRYVLRPGDFTAFVQALQRRDLRVRPSWVLAGTGLLSALWVGGPMSEGVFDPTSLLLAGVFATAIGLLGLGPWWMPRLFTPGMVRAALWLDPARLPTGDVDLRVGPSGGWSSSARGESRFAWGDVVDLLEGEGVVVLLFGPLTGLIVPDRALGGEREAFVARCRGWMGAPSEPPVQRPPLRPPGPPPDPFAPPSHGL